PRRGPEDGEKEKLYRINIVAAEYYHHVLTGTTAGEKARLYLEHRGISPATALAFQLGYSLDSWDALSQRLLGRGYSEKDLVGAGLAVEREGGGSYDRFRNRLMFPIRDAQGRVTGFGARALDESSPKYMNSPQTLIFDKGSILYGIDLAKDAIRRDNLVVIVEGYMDVMMAHQAGFRNVVASMGTSLTERQASILRRLTKRLTLALDADAAGTEATLRGVETIDRTLDRKVVPVPDQRGLMRYETTVDAEVRIIVLPAGKDPDEVIREDPAAWQRLVDESLPVMDYVLNAVASRVDLGDVRGRSEVVSRVLPIISGSKEPVRQAHYLRKLAQLVSVDERVLWDTLREAKATRRAGRAPLEPKRSVLASGSSQVEDYCLALLLQNPGLRGCCEGLIPEYFEDSGAREILCKWLQSPDLETLRTTLDHTLEGSLDRLLAGSLPPANATQLRHQLSDCILALRERWLRGMEARKALLLREAGAGGPDVELEKLQEQGTSVPQELHELFHQPKGKRRLRPPSEHRSPGPRK
ncbi:MAG: toprim domain-containing protein, partial [Chloroflexota bacterium]